VIGVDVHASVPALHDAGDERLGVQRVVLAGEDLADRPPVAVREPGHSPRMDVQLTKPLDAGKGVLQGLKNLVRVTFVARIMGGLVGGTLSGTGHGQHHSGAAWHHLLAVISRRRGGYLRRRNPRPEECDACFEAF
jgi:hypothetical protein